ASGRPDPLWLGIGGRRSRKNGLLGSGGIQVNGDGVGGQLARGVARRAGNGIGPDRDKRFLSQRILADTMHAPVHKDAPLIRVGVVLGGVDGNRGSASDNTQYPCGQAENSLAILNPESRRYGPGLCVCMRYGWEVNVGSAPGAA